MGCNDHGHSSPIDRTEEFDDLPGNVGWETCGWFISEEERRRSDDCPRDRGPLLFTTRQLMRKPPGIPRHAHQIHGFGHEVTCTDPPVHAGDPEAEGHILLHGLLGEEPDVLEHNP